MTTSPFTHLRLTLLALVTSVLAAGACAFLFHPAAAASFHTPPGITGPALGVLAPSAS